MDPSEPIIDRSNVLTEQRLAASRELDRLPILAAIELMSAQDAAAVAAVAAEKHAVAAAVAMVADALRSGGRLIYIGAGTSGRLGVLDASECPPTFSTPPEKVQGIIAGGEAAMFRSQEGVEDQSEGGAAAIDEKRVNDKDVVCGIAAGGTTPFVRGALQRASERGAKTIFICCVKPGDNEPKADIVIRPLTGPEVLTGSTRLKAGTATKLVLNQITTLAMVQLGKVYENLMVDVRASNQKLRDRAVRIVQMISGADRTGAQQLLKAAEGEVKTAVVMHAGPMEANEARRSLQASGWNLRTTLEKLRSQQGNRVPD